MSHITPAGPRTFSGRHATHRGATRKGRSRATYRHLALWTLQGLIAMFFIAAGYAKLTEPMDI